MKFQRELNCLAALGLLFFALPASAQLLGGMINGNASGVLGGGPLGGALHGGVLASGQLGGSVRGVTDATGEALRTTVDSTRNSLRHVAGETREVVRGTAEVAQKAAVRVATRVRHAPGRSLGVARAVTGNVAERTSQAVQDVTDGGLSESLSLNLNGNAIADGPDRHVDIDLGVLGNGSVEDGDISIDADVSGLASLASDGEDVQ